MPLATFELWQVLVLAVIQGVAEFLPISSDGHLTVAAPLLFPSGQTPEMLDLTITLHLGTLGSILVYYRSRVLALLHEDRRVLGRMLLGTLPAVVLVLVGKTLLERWFEPILQSTLVAGLMLPVTGIVLLWSLYGRPGDRDYRHLTWLDALLIGCAQATAILPGLSRSGTTIAAGLGRGLSRGSAATFSFLLAIPALAGAGLYEGYALLKDGHALSTSPTNLAIGAAVSFFVGLAALRGLSAALSANKLHWFGWYCIALGGLVLVWQLAG